MKRLTTFDILNLTHDQKMNGVFFSGIEYEGEYKKWWSNGKLCEHSFYKDKKEHGECKLWYDNGQLFIHCFYKNGKLIKWND